MEWAASIATVVISLVVPFVVSLCTSKDMSSNAKRWVAIVFSVIAGIATGFITGAPTPETLVTWALAIVGGVQAAYSLFKSIGVTSHVLDALSSVGSCQDDKKPEE